MFSQVRSVAACSSSATEGVVPTVAHHATVMELRPPLYAGLRVFHTAPLRSGNASGSCGPHPTKRHPWFAEPYHGYKLAEHDPLGTLRWSSSRGFGGAQIAEQCREG
jgi:hypothetical protein